MAAISALKEVIVGSLVVWPAAELGIRSHQSSSSSIASGVRAQARARARDL
jgi:hypothetical protein